MLTGPESEPVRTIRTDATLRIGLSNYLKLKSGNSSKDACPGFSWQGIYKNVYMSIFGKFISQSHCFIP